MLPHCCWVAELWVQLTPSSPREVSGELVWTATPRWDRCMHAQSIHSVSSATPRGLKGSYFLTHPAWTCLEKLLHFFTVIALLYSAFDIARLDKSVRSGFYEPCGNRVAGCVSLADLTAIHSMIGYRHHPVVRLSIRLSLSVTLCIVALRVGVWCKNCTSVFLAGKFACQFRHFCCRTYRLGKKRTGKKTSRRKRERETQKTMRALVYSALLTVENLRRSTSRTLLDTFEWIEFGCVHKI